MVDLDSNPTKLIEVVEIGKQLLITRGSLTTFSIANDVAKYFAIIPAMFAGVLPALDRINVMDLDTPRSAIASAVIFNALIIVALIPLALRGVRFRAESAAAVLRRNLLIYGVGGIVAPFVGIKLIDLVISALGVSCMNALIRQLRPALVAVVVFTVDLRARLPARRHRGRPGRVAGHRQRLAHRARRRRRRLRADRPAVQLARVLPPPAVGGRRRLRRRRVERLQPRPDEPGLPRHRRRARRRLPRRQRPRRRRARSRRRRHRLRVRARPAHLGAQRRAAGAACRRRRAASSWTRCWPSSMSTRRSGRSGSSVIPASTCWSSTSPSTTSARRRADATGMVV